MDKKAKWIWIKNENSNNTWLCFLKTINIAYDKISARAKIAADTKYWLYINGKLVVFEGGLKRGMSPKSTYYDELDISTYLKQGKNTIAALVCFFGKNGFSHISSGMGGFLFDADICGERIVSDSSWKVKIHPAYINASEDSNYRFAEPNVCFDATADLGKWYMTDVSNWDFADELCAAGEGVFGGLIKRPIPLFKDYGLKEGKLTIDEDGDRVVAKMKLPHNMQFTPYFRITASAGGKIILKTDTFDDYIYDTKSVMAEYYTTDSEQEYESLGWMSGETLYISAPKDTVFHSVKYRETGYYTEFAGSFECDDTFLNKLWQKSLRTLYITMRDNFMDCPDRERAQWWGDVNIEMQMAMYSLDKNALLLYKKGAEEMAEFAKANDRIITVVPSGTEQFELPQQNLAGIWGFSYYHFYTGDTDLIKKVYQVSKKYVMEYGLDNSGLVNHKTGSWDWADWGDNCDVTAMENAWYYMALNSCKYMAELLDENEDIQWYDKTRAAIYTAYNKLLWTNDCYYGKTDNKLPDDRANALAILSGLADTDKHQSIIDNVLVKITNASPYMEKYVLDAMCESGYIDKAVERMKTRYKEMTDCEYSTLWEYWNTDGTKNHAWSGGPMITMSKYIAGIYPADTAYKKIMIKPCLLELNYIKCTVPSAVGEISLEVKRNSKRTTMKVNLPTGIIADVYIPCGNIYKKYIVNESAELIYENE